MDQLRKLGRRVDRNARTQATDHGLAEGVARLSGKEVVVLGEGLDERHELVENDAVAVDVDLLGVLLHLHDLGRQPVLVELAAGQHRAHEARQAKVADLGERRCLERGRVQKDVGAAQVAVDDWRRERVEVPHALRDVERHTQARMPRAVQCGRRLAIALDLAVVQHVVEVAERNQLHHHAERLVAQAHELHQLLVPDLAHDPRLALKLEELAVARGVARVATEPARFLRERLGAACAARALLEQLERDRLAFVGGLVHEPEGAAAELAHDRNLVERHQARRHVGERHVGRQHVDANLARPAAPNEARAAAHRVHELLDREQERVVAAGRHAMRARHLDRHLGLVPAFDHGLDVLDQQAQQLARLVDGRRLVAGRGRHAHMDRELVRRGIVAQQRRLATMHQHAAVEPVAVVDQLDARQMEVAHKEAREEAQRQELERVDAAHLVHALRIERHRPHALDHRWLLIGKQARHQVRAHVVVNVAARETRRRRGGERRVLVTYRRSTDAAKSLEWPD